MAAVWRCALLYDTYRTRAAGCVCSFACEQRRKKITYQGIARKNENTTKENDRNRYRWKIYIIAMYDRDLNVKKQSKQIITFCLLKYNLKLTQTNITEGRLHYKT